MIGQSFSVGVFFLFFLTSCGYRWQSELRDGVLPTVVVPFISGDEEGVLTNEIAAALSSSNFAK